MDEQLQLLPETEIDKLNKKIEGTITSQDNLRRGMFSRHDTLFKMYSELKDENQEQRFERKYVLDELMQMKRELSILQEQIAMNYPSYVQPEKKKCLTFCI